MATYNELKKYAETHRTMEGHYANEMRGIYMDSFGEHLPSRVSAINDGFCNEHYDIPGLQDNSYGRSNGFTEPEEWRDAFAANQALSRIHVLMPVLEQMNTKLPAEDLDSPRYTDKMLHLANEIIYARQSGMEEDKLNYLIDEAFPSDYGYYGAKHHEYKLTDARWKFEHGLDVDMVRELQSIDDSLVKQAVDFYVDDCTEHKLPVNKDIMRVIALGNSDEAHAMYDEMYSIRGVEADAKVDEKLIVDKDPARVDEFNRMRTYVGSPTIIGFAEKGYTARHGEIVHDCIKQMTEAAGDERYQKIVDITYPDGDTGKISRFSSDYAAGYVESYTDLYNMRPELKDDLSGDAMKDLTQHFIEDSSTQQRWISDYYKDEGADYLKEKIESLGKEPARNPEPKMLIVRQKDVFRRDGAYGPFIAISHKNGDKLYQTTFPTDEPDKNGIRHRSYPHLRAVDDKYMRVMFPTDTQLKVSVISKNEKGSFDFDNKETVKMSISDFQDKLQTNPEKVNAKESYTSLENVQKFMNEEVAAEAQAESDGMNL